jgi:hypothetical protein
MEIKEDHVYVTTKPLEITYFKAWQSGDALVGSYEEGDGWEEDYPEGKRFFVEYVAFDGYVYLSDVTEDGHPSSKHHYVIDRDRFESVMKFDQ